MQRDLEKSLIIKSPLFMGGSCHGSVISLLLFLYIKKWQVSNSRFPFIFPFDFLSSVYSLSFSSSVLPLLVCQISPLTYVSITVSVIPSLIRICPSFLPFFDLLPYYFLRQSIPVRAFPSSLPSASSILRQFYFSFPQSTSVASFARLSLPQVMPLFFFYPPVFSPSLNNLLIIIF